MKKMKLSLISLLLMLTLCLPLGGCKKVDSLKIEDHRWRFSLALSNKDGSVLYCAKDRQKLHPEAPVLKVTCKVKEDTLVIKSNGKTWTLPYIHSTEGPEGMIYKVGADGADLASVTKSTFSDGSWEHTLTLAVDQYTLYFRD